MNLTTETVHNKQRKQELRSDLSYIHIMKYMGSKRELLPDIKKSVDQMVRRGSTVLDLFAGTASVGAYLKKDYNVISNDVQDYSYVIAQALIESSSIHITHDTHLLVFKIEQEYIKNKERLISLLSENYKQSNRFVDIKKGEWTDQLRLEYLKFSRSFPSPLNKFESFSTELHSLKSRYFEKDQSVYLQTVFLFSETYFSLEQAMDIDSIRFAIDTTVNDPILKSIFLTALIYAYSYCSSGTGHFAMFRDLKDVNSIEDTFIYRKKRVWEYFLSKVEELFQYHQHIPTRTYATYSYDYVDLLKNDLIDTVDLIYADPPYSFVHYSRFYHAIESLIKYDYDIPQYKGRYRSDRFQSPFCQKTNVLNAFKFLFEKTKEKKIKLLLSYADSGMISLDEITYLLANLNFSYEVHKIQYDHSTLGRKGHKSNLIHEYLIQATPL